MSSIDFSINPFKIENHSHPVSEQVPTWLSADEVALTLLAAPKVIGIVAEPVARNLIELTRWPVQIFGQVVFIHRSATFISDGPIFVGFIALRPSSPSANDRGLKLRVP